MFRSSTLWPLDKGARAAGSRSIMCRGTRTPFGSNRFAAAWDGMAAPHGKLSRDVGPHPCWEQGDTWRHPAAPWQPTGRRAPSARARRNILGNTVAIKSAAMEC